MDPQAITQAIASSDALRGLPEASRAQAAATLQAIGSVRTAAPGGALIQAGHLGFSSGYFLLSGIATVHTASGRDIDVPAPALLGEMAQFKASDRRTATVTAKEPVTLLDFDWDDFYARMGSDHGAEAAAAVRAAIEALLWQRFNHPELLALPLFRGLPEPLMRKVCLPFAFLADRHAYSDGQRIFAAGERCQQTGHLLTRGTVKLKAGANEWLIASPHLMGVMPKNDPSLLWTADATAAGEATTYRFHWPTYLEHIQRRLSPTEQQQMIEAMKANAKEHLWH